MGNIIDDLNKRFEELQKKETKDEKKAYKDMTDGEKLKVKTAQLKKAKERNKELQAKIDFLEGFIKKNFKMTQPEKNVPNVPPKTM